MGGGACQGAPSLEADTRVGTGLDARSADCDIAGMQTRVRASLGWRKTAMKAACDVSVQVQSKAVCEERRRRVGLSGF